MAISNYSVVGLNLGEIRSNIKSFSDISILEHEVALNSDLDLGVFGSTIQTDPVYTLWRLL